MIALEPQVPTGMLVNLEQGVEMTPAQQVVASFNQWIEFVQSVNQTTQRLSLSSQEEQ